MKRKLIDKKVIVCIVIVVILVIFGMKLYRNRRVHFEDNKMRQVMCLELGKDKDYMGLTYKDLEKIEELRIGPVGEFETIRDVAKCKNLKRLLVNVEITDRQAYYELFKKTKDGKMYYPFITNKQVLRIERELEEILRSVRGIEEFRFTNINRTCDIKNVEFLKYAKNLKEIDMVFINIENYSILENCSKLERVDFSENNIKTADSLLKLKNVNKFILTGTPLAENEKEIKRLQEAFPEAEIIVD